VDDTVYIWTSLHEGFNTDKKARKEAYDNYFKGQITYEQWFNHDLILLKNAGATEDKIIKLIDGLKPVKGAKQTLLTLKKRGHRLAIISGSLDIVVNRLFKEINFDYLLINKIFFNSNGSIKGGRHTPYDIEKKAAGLLMLCKKEGIKPEQTLFTGDNENDIHVAKAAGFSIAFNCKSPKLARLCNVEIKEKNLMHILPFVK
jgi:phosphoserine phosphatase